MIKKSPILFLLSIFLLSACGLAQPTPTPTATPLPTSTPTRTPTLTPAPTPTLGPQYPASLSPADVEFLKAHADDPNVKWEFDAASGNTHVFINSDFDITNPALVEQIKAQCRNRDCIRVSSSQASVVIMGQSTGDLEIVIDNTGGIKLHGSLMTVDNDETDGRLQKVNFADLLDHRNANNDFLWRDLGISGDTVSIQELLEIFRPGKFLPLVFGLDPLHTPWVNQYLTEGYGYGEAYFQHVRRWFFGGMDPTETIELLVVGRFY